MAILKSPPLVFKLSYLSMSYSLIRSISSRRLYPILPRYEIPRYASGDDMSSTAKNTIFRRWPNFKKPQNDKNGDFRKPEKRHLPFWRFWGPPEIWPLLPWWRWSGSYRCGLGPDKHIPYQATSVGHLHHDRSKNRGCHF